MVLKWEESEAAGLVGKGLARERCTRFPLVLYKNEHQNI